MVLVRRIGMWAFSLLLVADCCACSRVAESESTSALSQAVSTSTTLELKLPVGQPPGSFALAANGTLSVNDGAVVSGQLVNTLGATQLGVDARSGEIKSTGGVLLRDRARVSGDIFTTVPVTRQASTVVEGTVFDHEVLGLQSRSLTFDFGSGSGGGILVQANQQRTVAPNSYTSFNVNAQGVANLSTGNYYFADFSLEPNSRLQLDTTKGPVMVFVRNSVVLRGSIAATVPNPAFLLVYAGTSLVSLETAFSGVILAPNAKLTLQTGGPFAGQAYAKDLELHQRLTFTGQAAHFWDTILTPLPSTSLQQTSSETLGDLLPNSALGSAVRAYVVASYASNSAAQRGAALSTLKSFPAADVVTALRSAFDATTDVPSRGALVTTAGALNDGAALPFFSDVLTRPVPNLSVTNAHDYTVVNNGKVLLAAVAGVEGLVRSGFTPARAVLVTAATKHPLAGVRRTAVFRVVQIGDASLRASVEAGLSPQDRPFLGLHPMTSADLVGVLPVHDFPAELPQNASHPGGPGYIPGLTPDSGGGGSGSGGSGGGTGGPCTEATAVDLGADGHNVTVRNDGCVRVRDAYPTWWSNRTMKLETTLGGSFPVPFVWSNSCTGSGGSGTFNADWQSNLLTSTSRACATVIDLQGAGNGNLTLRYWAQ